MQELQVIENFNAKIYGTPEEPLFLAKDIAKLLDIKQPSVMIRNVDEDEKVINSIQTVGGEQEMWFLTEGGLYEVLMLSRKPQAKAFKSEVKKVLKIVRTKGAYLTDQKAIQLLNGEGLAELLTQAAEQLRQKQLVIDNLKPKALFAEAVSASEDSILVSDLAKILKGNGVEIGQKRLFEWLRQNGYLIKRAGADFNMPTQKSMELGLFKIKESVINAPGRNNIIRRTPRVTGKGQIYFSKKFL